MYPVREVLDVWPLLPIVINIRVYRRWWLDNLVGALEHNDRICELDLSEILGWKFEEIWAATQQPFPALTRSRIIPPFNLQPVIPASFLGGSAPRLRSLDLHGTSLMLHFRVCRNCFCLPLSLFILHSGEFQIPCIFRPRRWCLACPCRPGSKHWKLDLNSLKVTPTREADLLFRQHELFSSLSLRCVSTESPIIWRTSWPGSMLLYSKTC